MWSIDLPSLTCSLRPAAAPAGGVISLISVMEGSKGLKRWKGWRVSGWMDGGEEERKDGCPANAEEEDQALGNSEPIVFLVFFLFVFCL